MLLLGLACTDNPGAASDAEQLLAPAESRPVPYPEGAAVPLPAPELGEEIELELFAELFVDPRGTRSVFVTAGGERVELDRARPEDLAYHGRRVRTRGELWTCRGLSIFHPRTSELLPGQHSEALAELPPPPRVRSRAQFEALRSPWARVSAEVVSVGSTIVILALDDGGALAVDGSGFASEGLEPRPGRRVSLVLERRDALPEVLAAREGEHERIVEVPAEPGTFAHFSARECERVMQLGL